MDISGAEATSSQAEIDRHLELGRDLLARGQLADALSHYHAAVGQFEDGFSPPDFMRFIRIIFVRQTHRFVFILNSRGRSGELLDILQAWYSLFCSGQSEICTE